MEYQSMTDEQLIKRQREGDSAVVDYIMDKYKNLVRKKAKAMYLLGGENDDLIQEGMIGLFKAVRDYDQDQEASFYSFADLCIARQMYTAIEASKRKKHIPLNSYVSLYEGGNVSEEQAQPPLIDIIQSEKISNPESIFLDKEYVQRFENELQDSLSELEKKVLYLHLLGTDYQTIGKLLGKSSKAIDNALQRIKSKAQIILKNERAE